MLFKKMFKDLQANLIQFLAIFTMAFISVSVLSGLSASSPDALDRYLTDTNYRDLDVQGQFFTREDIDALQDLPQIRSVNGYYNTLGKIELGEEKNILLTYLSGNDISEMLLKEGVPYTEGASGIWLDATFCEAMGIGCGDNVTIMSDNIRLNEEVKGMVYSPQYLYLEAILMQQNLILSAVGTVLGIPFGYRVLELLITTMGEDLDCMIQVSLTSYICTFMVTFLLSVIMNSRINAKIETIDMVTALVGV